MRCFKRKKLFLFYYRELKKDKLKIIEEHLRKCPSCSNEYKNIETLLNRTRLSKPQLETKDLDLILRNVRNKLEAPTFWEAFKCRIKELAQNLYLGLLFRRQLIPVMLTLVIILAVFPLFRSSRYQIEKEFDILQIELELSLENTDQESIFEIYEDPSILEDNMSSLGHPILHKYLPIVPEETSKLG